MTQRRNHKRKYFEIIVNENTTNKNLWSAAKLNLREL